MDHPQAKETICSHCNEVFPSKGKYQYHFQRVHQNKLKVNHSNQEETSIYRSENEKFICICGKGYQAGQSLHRHQKSCQQWKDHESHQDLDSDLEMSIQGDFLLYSILLNL